jgi:RNA polymerase sigma-70 factor, ECF subfamily
MDSTEPDLEFDVRFVERLQRRDEHAFSSLVVAYEKRVFQLVWRMLGSKEEAEDLTQEVFVQVFRSIHTFRGESKLGTWLYRIAINLAKNRTMYLARRHQRSHEDIVDAESVDANERAQGITTGETRRPDLDLVGSRTERIVLECLLNLEAEHRELLVLRDVECLSYEEVGAITGLLPGTVKSRLHRARGLLKQAVEARLGEKVP